MVLAHRVNLGHTTVSLLFTEVLSHKFLGRSVILIVLLAHTLWASIHGLVSLDLSLQLNQGASFEVLFAAMLDHILKDD